MDIRNELTLEQCREFFRCMSESGIHADPWYEAVPYEGTEKMVHLGLFASQDASAQVQVAEGDDYDGLDTLGSFLSNIPGFCGWRFWIEPGDWELRKGHFVIFEKRMFVGGNREPVVSLLRSLGVSQKIIDHTLNMVEEKVLGYVLSPSLDDVQTLIDGLTVGANSPDYEGTIEFVQSLLDRAKQPSSQTSQI